MKTHRMHLQVGCARLEHKFKMAKFLFNIHQLPAVRSLVTVSVAFIVIVIMPVVIIIVAVAATESGGQQQD